jgi:GMP synthase-like glutamine amidotransferase
VKLTILETGEPPKSLHADFTRYPAMFEKLISPHAPHIQFETARIAFGEAFPDPVECDAVLITGSPAGVYDPLPWISPLMDFIRGAAAARTPMIGVCFGHQAIAEALGGKVVKSHKGWGLGRHVYSVKVCPVWASGCGTELRAAVSHQDQVVQKPPGADVIASSDFTEFAVLHYPQVPALSFQCHPEFDDAFAGALYTSRGESLGPQHAADAVASLNAPHDNAHLGKMMVQFLQSAL